MKGAMKASQMFPGTKFDDPTGTTMPSHSLLVRAGYIMMASGGVYFLSPLALRVLHKIEAIIRDEMNKAGGLEMTMPIIQEQRFWEMTDRWAKYLSAGIMFTTKAGPVTFGLAPTAEEMVTWFTQRNLSSWRQLPLMLYQIGWKFRCEARPQGGLTRGREFGMKDLYSFDADEEGMRRSFEAMRQAYTRCFRRMSFNCIDVQADSGAIGGQGSAEFMAVCENGHDTLICCPECGYGANLEKATSLFEKPGETYTGEKKPIRREHTPDTRTVEELEELFDMRGHQMVKTIIYVGDPSQETEVRVAVCCRGDLTINETKLKNLLGCEVLEIAADVVVEEVTRAPVGFAGPIGLQDRVDQILFDTSTEGMTNFLCGCNEEDYHMLDVNWESDIPLPDKFHDLHDAEEGDLCAECEKGHLETQRGIELGHIFMLQQGYAKSMEVTFLDRDGQRRTPWMGCYGIGTTRCLQAAVEQHHDDKGIVWPMNIAPYHLAIIPVSWKNEEQRKLAEHLFSILSGSVGGYEVVLDDRNERFGVKIKDAELIGYPGIIIVGRKAASGIVEVRDRRTGESKEVSAEHIHLHLPELP